MDVASLGLIGARTWPCQRLLLLSVLLGLALALRLPSLGAPLQQDEFGPLHAVATRPAPGPGLTPAASAPLLPVRSLDEVSERSVLPYGIRNPLPLYHDLLYLVIQVLPIAAWTLRLPSLLAGLGCVTGMHVLGRRCGGPATGLMAALLTAMEPGQVALSTVARPYALANLACIFSFLALLALMQARCLKTGVQAAIGLGMTFAFLGYTNPVLLLVGLAHLGVLTFVLLLRVRHFACSRLGGMSCALLFAAGCSLAGLLLLPEREYIAEVSRFSALHQAYLRCFGPPRLLFFLLHNSPVAIAFGAAGAVLLLFPLRTQTPPFEPAVPAMAAPVVGGLWLVLPQAASLLLYLLRGQSICLSRYLSYTTLGGILALAYWATRARPAGLRLALSAVMAAALGLWGTTLTLRNFYQSYLLSDTSVALRLEQLCGRENEGLLRQGDLILVRSGFLEADFLWGSIAPAAWPDVEAASAAPLLTLCAGRASRPYLVLSLSERSASTATSLGAVYDPAHFYNEELAHRLCPYARFWIIGPDWDRQPFLACFLPWLADTLGSSLKHSDMDGISLVERRPLGAVAQTFGRGELLRPFEFRQGSPGQP